ncbi:unnamed protein product [Ilex paraguariensis]|uniref:non-specific serine/threonine protein kinase n=1 Tax=Ilex paraguariensis TaxID=185542 RepID=A0ABC8TAT3_9AQUA
MGNCIQKCLQQPDEPVGIAQPPTGLNEIEISHPQKVSKTLRDKNLSSLHTKKGGVYEIRFPNQGKSSKPLGKTSSSISLNTRDERINGIQISHPGETSKPVLQERNSLVPSNTKKGVDEIQISHSGPASLNIRKDERYGTYDSLKMSMKADQVLQSYKLNFFCYNTLKIATQRFSDKNLLGRGGCGEVYKGWIHYCTMNAAKPGDGYPIAVKKLRKEGAQGQEEWENELKFLSRFNHPNLVKLIGYCSDIKHKFLVYEYMPKGNLETNLLKGNKHQQH